MTPRCYLSENAIRMWLRPLIRRGNPNRLYTGSGTGEPPERRGFPFLDVLAVRRDSWTLGFPRDLTDNQIKEGLDLYLRDWALLFWFNGSRSTIRPLNSRSLNFVEPNLEWPTITNDTVQEACMADQIVTLGRVPSRRDSRVMYSVTQDPETQTIACDCPGFINSKRDPRSCRHTLVYAMLLSDEAVRPGESVIVPTPPSNPLADYRNAQMAETVQASNTRNAQAAAPPPPAPTVRATVEPQVGQLWNYRGLVPGSGNAERLVMIVRMGSSAGEPPGWFRLAEVDPSTGYLDLSRTQRVRSAARFAQRATYVAASPNEYRQSAGIFSAAAATGEEALVTLRAAKLPRPTRLRTLTGDRAPRVDPGPAPTPTRQIDFDDD